VSGVEAASVAWRGPSCPAADQMGSSSVAPSKLEMTDLLILSPIGLPARGSLDRVPSWASSRWKLSVPCGSGLRQFHQLWDFLSFFMLKKQPGSRGEPS
jgi:hypothetical protein